MRRLRLGFQLCAVLGLTVWLVGASAPRVEAQGDPTATSDAAAGTPTVGGATVPTPEATSTPSGTLKILVYRCTTGGDAGTGALLGEGEFTPGDACTAAKASIALDGGDPFDVTSSGARTLGAGTHSVVDTTTGATKDIEIAGGGTTTVFVVSYTAAPKVADAPPVTVHLIEHVCPPAIQTQDQFGAIGNGGFVAHLLACPVITRPDNAGPEGAIHGTPAAFDFTMAAGDQRLALANATFTPAQLCERDLGADLNNNPNDNACYDTSGYGFAVKSGAVTITETTAPKGTRFGAVELPDAGDRATLVATHADTGAFDLKTDLDATGDGQITVHVYNFTAPRVSVVVHACPKAIVTKADFDALGDFGAKLKACPVVERPGDQGPNGAIGGGQLAFDVSLQAGTGAVQTIADATFAPATLCESDLKTDVNGNPNDNICFDASRYQFDNVPPGNVVLSESTLPPGRRFGAVAFAPGSGDEQTLANVDDQGTITLDTTSDGDVTVHIYAFVQPDSSGGNGGNGSGNEMTPTPGGNGSGPRTSSTATGGGGNGGGPGRGGDGTSGATQGAVGSIQVIELFCIGSASQVEVRALDPGVEPGPGDLGDGTCITAGGGVQITAFGQTDLGTFNTGGAGGLVLSQIPVTTTQTGLHVITDLASRASAEFQVAVDTTTKIIFLNWEADIVDYGPGAASAAVGGTAGDGSAVAGGVVGDSVAVSDGAGAGGDAASVTSGNGLPRTGLATPPGGESGTTVFLLGVVSLLVLGEACRLRCRLASAEFGPCDGERPL